MSAQEHMIPGKVRQGHKAPFPTLDVENISPQLLEQAAGALASVGIETGGSSLERVKRAALLVRALAAGTHRFIRSNEPLAIDKSTLIYPESVHGKLPLNAWEWTAIHHTWGCFDGGEGIAIDVPEPLLAEEYLWGTLELMSVLKAWGAQYQLQAGTDAEPIRVHYTGRRFGGPVAGRQDISQIGMSAAISLPSGDLASTAAEALAEAAPGYRLRANESSVLEGRFNIMLSSVRLPTDVLEPHPEIEWLKQRPASLGSLLKRYPDFFDHYEPALFTYQFVDSLAGLSGRAVCSVFNAFHEKGLSTLLLMEAVEAQKAEGILLAALSSEGRELIAGVLQLDPDDLSPTVKDRLMPLDNQLRVLVVFHSISAVMDALPKDWSKLSIDDMEKVNKVTDLLSQGLDSITNAPNLWAVLKSVVEEVDIMALLQGQFTPPNSGTS